MNSALWDAAAGAFYGGFALALALLFAFSLLLGFIEFMKRMLG